MSGRFETSFEEARGYVASSADIDSLAIVLGCSSSGTGLSAFFLSGDAARTDRGYGDAVDSLAQIIEQPSPNGSSRKFPAAMYSTGIGTQGSYGAIDRSGVTGSAQPTFDASVLPYGTFQPYVRFINDLTLGTTGGQMVVSLDDGRTGTDRVIAVGTALTYSFAENVKINLGSSTATYKAGDIIRGHTYAPVPAAADVDDAFVQLARSSYQFGIVACDFPADADMIAHFTTGLNVLKAAGKRATLLCRTRTPDWETDETRAAWAAAIAANFVNARDSRIVVDNAYGLLTDALTGRQYLRSDFGQWVADVVRVPRRVTPDVPADQPENNFKLVDGTGTTIGHDEGPRGDVTGLSNETLGNRFRCVERLPDAERVEDVFSTVPWTLYAPDERIRNLAVRRIANAIERVATSVGNSALGSSDLEYFPAEGSEPAKLTFASRNAIRSTIFQRLSAEFADDIQNAHDASDTGLVQVDEVVKVTGGNLLELDCTIAPKVKGILLKLRFTLAVSQ